MRHLATAVLLALGVAPGVLALETCGDWQQVFPWPTGASLNGVTYGNGRFVAVGDGVVLVSDDGVVWSVGETWTDLDLRAVTWAGDRFVAVGGSGPSGRQGQTAWSRDGLGWHVVSVPVGRLVDVAWDGRELVAVGWDTSTSGVGFILRSPSGEIWTAIPAPPPAALAAVTCGGGVWVALGSAVGWDQAVATILRSSDAVSWETAVTSGGRDEGWWDVQWDGDRFVASGHPTTLVSPDGSTWSELPAAPYSGVLGAHDGQLVVAGVPDEFHGAPLDGALAASSDASTWTELPRAPRAVHALGFFGHWVAVGFDGLVGTSPDGRIWRWGWQGWWPALSDVASNGSEFVAVGGNSVSFIPKAHVLSSRDGLGWTGRSGNFCSLNSVDWTGASWVAVGSWGAVVTSPDAFAWPPAVCPDEPSYEQAPYRASASSRDALVLVNRDGLDTVVGGTTHHFPVIGATDVLWTGGRFVVVGDGLTGWSDDGVAWTLTASSASLAKLAFDGSRLVAVGGSGASAWSGDGLTWAATATGTAADLTELAWAGDRFVAGSADGTVVESVDGGTWVPAGPFPLPSLAGLAWTGRELVAVTGDGTISRRRCGGESALPDSAPRRVVAVAAHRPGVSGTAWRSDLQVVAPGDHWAEVWVGLVPVGAQRPTWQRFVLPPGGQLDRSDVVLRTFGLEQAAGPLLVASEQAVAVISRSSTETAAGTHGEVFPGLGADEAVHRRALLPMLEQDDAFRTNLGLTNLGAATITAEVELFDASGALLGTSEHEVEPLAWVQVDGILGPGPVADAYAVVSCADPDACFLAYASLVEQRTGDPTLVLPARLSSEPLLIPAVAHTPGAAGTFWRSAVEVANAGDASAEYRLELLAGESSSSRPFTLAPGQARRHPDVASALGVSGTAGLLVVPTRGAVAATSRTFTSASGGTVGQGVPALSTGRELAQGARAVLPGLAESPGFRSNIGLANLADAELAVTVELYRGDGGLVGTLERSVPATSLLQLNRPFSWLGVTELDGGYAVVTTTTPGSRWLAWASVVDTATGDPSFVLGQWTPELG